jgi:hypothetical protein
MRLLEEVDVELERAELVGAPAVLARTQSRTS